MCAELRDIFAASSPCFHPFAQKKSPESIAPDSQNYPHEHSTLDSIPVVKATNPHTITAAHETKLSATCTQDLPSRSKTDRDRPMHKSFVDS